MEITLILLAAGKSNRFGLDCKKQNMYIGSEPLWLHLARKYDIKFKFKKIIIVCDEPKFYKSNEPKYTYVKGGEQRGQSIINALQYVETELVMISDVARVFVSQDIINELINNIKDYDVVFPAINVVDTVFNNKINSYINRDELLLVQTPQLSKTQALKNANLIDFTDESSAVLANGGKVKAIKGNELNFKLTHKNDLYKLKLLNLPSASKDTFIGYGYDVHEFCKSNIGHSLNDTNKNDTLILAGVDCGKEFALKAHSDGDVVAHALIDALFGACGLGDIGEAFPPDDMKYNNYDSMQLLNLAYKKCKSYGFELINVDITICAEAPKLKDFKQDMLLNLISTLNTNNINIKATTTEKLGFVGRKEGISVSAVVNMKLFDWSNNENFNS